MAPTSDGRGFWLSSSVGQVFHFGDAHYYGDLYQRGINNALGVAATAPTAGVRRAAVVIEAPTVTALNARLVTAARKSAIRAAKR